MVLVSLDLVIVGGGMSGLTVAFELSERRPDWDIRVLEKEEIAGGKVRSSSAGGFTFDWGPNGFQPAPQTFELVARLGLEDELIAASDRTRNRYIYRDGGLRRVPLKPQEFLASELLSPAGKLRVLLEPLLAGSGVDREESVYDFVGRHFGREAARSLASPMVLGVTAGDARRLSVDALFPRFRQLERDHKSLFRAMAARRRATSGEGAEVASQDGSDPPSGSPSSSTSSSNSRSAALYSFAPGSMGTLTAELSRHLSGSLQTGTGVEAVGRKGSSFDLTLSDGSRLETERLVLATPAFVSAGLLGGFLPEAAGPLGRIPYADVTVFALAFHRVDVPHSLDGFGFLVPRGEGVRSLGVIWTSSLFEGSSPPGTVLLRVIAGGSVDPEFARLDEEQALAAVRRDLRLTMGITARPLLAQRIPIARAIPQYELGHGQSVKEAMTAVRSVPGLFLAGNAYFGVAVNDCVRDSRRVAQEITAGE